MKTIYHYTLPVEDGVLITMPRGAKVLSAAAEMVPSVVRIYAFVDTDAPEEARRFYVRATGAPITGDPGYFVGTVDTGYGLIWHVFEEGERRNEPMLSGPDGSRIAQYRSGPVPAYPEGGEDEVPPNS